MSETVAEEVHVIPLTIFESIKSSLFERSKEGLTIGSSDALYNEFFRLMDDTSTDTLLKKKKVIDKFLLENNIGSITEFYNSYNASQVEIANTSIVLGSTFFKVIGKINKIKHNVTVGILEVMLKSKLEKDLRKEDEIINSN
jgi:hypothetical protein